MIGEPVDNVDKDGVFPAATPDRAAVVGLVRAVSSAAPADLTQALADPRLHTALRIGSSLHLLGTWHAVCVRAEFGEHPSTDSRFLDRIINIGDRLTDLGHEIPDEQIRDFAEYWQPPPAGVGRADVAASDKELLALAVSVDQSLRARKLDDAAAHRQIAQVADDIALMGALPAAFTPVHRGWSDGAAALAMLIRHRRRSGAFAADGFANAAERAGLLIDIAFHLAAADIGAMLDRDLDSVTFPPARQLLGLMSRRPAEPIEYWIGQGPAMTYDLAEIWDRAPHRSASPPWSRQHSDPPDPRQPLDVVVRLIEEHYSALAAAPGADPYENATAVVLSTTGQLWTGTYRSSGGLLANCGAATPLIGRVHQFMITTRQVGRRQGSNGGLGY